MTSQLLEPSRVVISRSNESSPALIFPTLNVKMVPERITDGSLETKLLSEGRSTAK